MKIIYFGSEGNLCVCTPSLDCGIPIEEIARKDVPAGAPYKIVADEDVEQYRSAPFSAYNCSGVGVGAEAWFVETLQAEIAAIEAEPLPEQPSYPEQPVNDEAEQFAAIQVVKDAVPELLPANMPPQTQDDFTNALKNANAIAAYENAVASAEAGFISYAQKMAGYRAECDKLDQQHAEVVAAALASKDQRIAQLQAQIDALQAG